MLRKQMRHILNWRIKARGRPQMGQRFFFREENLGVNFILTMKDNLDTARLLVSS
jgi:hypothetical protein